MIKKIIPFIIAGALTGMAALSGETDMRDLDSSMRRLTRSGKDAVKHPCLSRDGRRMLYMTEPPVGEDAEKTIRIMDLYNGKEKELFRDNQRQAPEPYAESMLVIGTKPPLLSGDGETAVFVLGMSEPHGIMDHFMAVADLEEPSIKIISFSIPTLEKKDLHSLEFDSADWERISHYALSDNGDRLACVVKGHLGPQRYGYASGIVLMDLKMNTQEMLLAPDFTGEAWTWPGFPQRPLMGGGWAFGLSGNGKSVLFGARSSSDTTDYDLYLTDWDTKKTRAITDFHDRWFSLADIDHDGKRIVFFYSGKKKEGMGTYALTAGSPSIRKLESRITPRIEFIDMSPDGRFIVYKHVYKGLIMNLQSGREFVAFDEKTPGYPGGLTPMDFPALPSFWTPQIMTSNGHDILLIGPPAGKETSEIYLLHIGND